MNHWGKRIRAWVVFGVCFAVTLELASRVDQWVAYGAPILGVYTYDSALFTTDEFGIRGKPYGQYEKWKLNGLGLRGDDIALEKPNGRFRVICVGASETFGLFEAPGHEWPRQLEADLRLAGRDVEVINGAIAGMTLPQRIRHLQHRLLQLKPDLVVFMVEYGSYAGLTQENLVRRRTVRPELPQREGIVEGLKSIRIVGRMKDVVLPRLPDVVRDPITRNERSVRISMQQRALGKDFRSFVHVRPFEAEILERDLGELVTLTEQAGVRLVLTSPAMWFTERNQTEMYLSWPYLDATWWQEARATLPSVVNAFAEKRHIPFVDLSVAVAGREPELMRDFFHFSDRGAEQVAGAVARAVSKSVH